MSQIGGLPNIVTQDPSLTTIGHGTAQTGPAGDAGQPPLPQGIVPTASFAHVHAAAAQTIPAATGLQGAAAAGRTGFMAAVSRFLNSVFSGTRIPAQVTAQMPPPGGGTVDFDGKSLESMINALPRGQRAGAIANLSQTLSHRIANGKAMYDNAMAGNAAHPSEDDVADMMLYFKAKAMAQGHQYAEGAYSIEDPQGNLARFLDSCPGRYQRSSTHIDELQRASVDGHLNTHRGIDFNPGHGMPHGHETVLFGTIPQFGNEPRRLFLKTETYGARISTLSAGDRARGTPAQMQADRPIRLRDAGKAISHLGSLISSKFASQSGTKKERIPDAVKNGYQAIMDGWKSRGKNDPIYGILSQNGPLSHGGGIRVMLANLDQAMQHVRQNPDADGAAADLQRLMQEKATLFSLIPDQKHMSGRIGNEVMFQTAEL
ncbi:MAG: hypothetical protein J5855_07195 [Mailhella sp.]|nr:hypothetical protein [Mailhella sp.]